MTAALVIAYLFIGLTFGTYSWACLDEGPSTIAEVRRRPGLDLMIDALAGTIFAPLALCLAPFYLFKAYR